LRQGIREIEFIADPEAGELRIGAPESLSAGFLVAVLERFLKDHPRVRFHVVPVRQPTLEFPELLRKSRDARFWLFYRAANDSLARTASDMASDQRSDTSIRFRHARSNLTWGRGR
jgi:DNA-binding transcriptional LysR family regulator